MNTSHSISSNKWTLHSTSSNKWTHLILQVLTNERLPFFSLTMCQLASSNKRTIFAIILQFSHKRHPRSVRSRGVAKRFCLHQNVVRTNTIIENHVPQWNYITPKRNRIPLLQQAWVSSRCRFLSQSICFYRLTFIIASQAFIAS